MATNQTHTTTDQQATTTTASGATAVLTTLSDFVSLIETTDDGEVIYPEEIAGFRRLKTDHLFRTEYVAPVAIETTAGRVEEQWFILGIHSPTGGDHYEAAVQIGRRFSSWEDSAVMATGDTELEAVENAAEWLKTHGTPDVSTVYRPGDVDRPVCSDSIIENHAERIREGSRVYVDSLPPAQVTAELNIKDTAVALTGGTVWECELMNQSSETFHLHVEGGYKSPVSYAGSLADYKARTRVEHLTVDNEENLRASVNRPVYRWLKARQGETVIRQTGDHSLRVIEVDELRDGFLNPSDDGGLDPDGHTRATYIGEETSMGEWFDNEVDLPTGKYKIRENGVVEPNDIYAADPVLSAAEWDAFGAFGPTDEATETTTTLNNTLPADRTPLSRDDNITDITGVGPSTAEKMWHETVGELYDAGFPSVFAPNQYTDKIIADLYTVSETPTPTDAARAVLGVLGGAGYDADGEVIGTAASLLTDSMDLGDVQTAWLGYRRLKGEYTPGWVGEDDSPTALGAGQISTDDIEKAATKHRFDDDAIDAEPVTGIRKAATGHDGKVALTTDEGNYVEIRKDVIQTAATIANVDLSEIGNDGNHVSIYPDDGEGVVFLSNTKRPFNVVIDTNSYVEDLYYA